MNECQADTLRLRLLRFNMADTHHCTFSEQPALIGSFEAVDPSAPVVKWFIRIGHAMKGIDIRHSRCPIAFHVYACVREVMTCG